MVGASVRPFGSTRHFRVDPNTPFFDGITRAAGSKVAHGGDSNQIARLFGNGVLCVEYDTGSRWSSDDGGTWQDAPFGSTNDVGPNWGGEKMRPIPLSGAEMAVFHRTMVGASSPYSSSGRKANMDWTTATLSSFTAYYDIPLSIPLVGDAGDSEDAFLRYGSSVWLKRGPMAMLAYGNYDADPDGWPAYPTTLATKKFRVISMESDDAVNFDTPATAFNPLIMSARNNLSESSDPTLGNCWALTQEGFNECDMVRAGDRLLAVARSGGRKPGASKTNAAIFPTPLYWTFATDDGVEATLDWEPARQLVTSPDNALIGGVKPHLQTIGNNLVVLATADETGTYVAVADYSEVADKNNGNPALDFQGVERLSSSATYVGMVRIGFYTVLVAYQDDTLGHAVIPISYYPTGEASTPDLDLYIAGPHKVASGGSTWLEWWSNNLENVKIWGGGFGANEGAATSVNADYGATTGALTAETTFHVKGNLVGDVGTTVEKTVTVGILA